MSNQKNFLLAYCPDNTNVALELDHRLRHAGITFEHVQCEGFSQPGDFAEALRQGPSPVVLILTDNFLKSYRCMGGLLAALLQLYRTERVLAVTAEGRYRQPEGEWEPAPTSFEKVVDAIRYMNFWQNEYLELRKQKPATASEEPEGFSEKIQAVRQISTEVGDVLNFLRTNGYTTLDGLRENDFELFFEHFGLTQSHRMSIPEESPPPTDEELLRIFENAEQVSREAEPEPEEAPPASLPSPVEIQPEPETSTATMLSDFHDDELHDDDDDDATPPTTDSTNHPEDILHEATELIQSGKTDAGLGCFQASLLLHPDNTVLRYYYAYFLARSKGNFAEAAAQLEILLTQDAENDNAYFLLGEIAERHHDYSAAKNHFEKVAAINPDYPHVYYKLGGLLAQHSPGQTRLAAYYFKLAVAQDGDNAEAHYRYAGLLTETLGKSGKAAKHLQKCVEIYPAHPFAHYDLALIFHAKGDKSKAHEHYQLACANNPELRTAENDAAFHFEGEPPMPPSEKAIEQPELAVVRPASSTDLAGEASDRPPSTVHRPPLTILITGATSGIGRATAEIFAKNGCRLILTGRRADRLDLLKETFVHDFGNEILTLCFDVRHLEEVKNAIENLPAAWREVDILVNNAGLAKGLAPIHEGDFDHWEAMIDTNLKGLLFMTRLVAPGMVSRRKGHIINVGSTAGKEVYPSGNVYCATKFAVDSLTRAMRMDLHTHQVRVSSVSPAHVEGTEFAINRFDGDADRAASVYANFQPLQPADVAEVIYFIATRPPQVNVLDVVVQATQQASSTLIDRSGRS